MCQKEYIVSIPSHNGDSRYSDFNEGKEKDENIMSILSAEMMGNQLEVSINSVNDSRSTTDYGLSFWLNTAATHHIVNSDKYFSKMIKLKTPIVINIAKNNKTNLRLLKLHILVIMNVKGKMDLFCCCVMYFLHLISLVAC